MHPFKTCFFFFPGNDHTVYSCTWLWHKRININVHVLYLLSCCVCYFWGGGGAFKISFRCFCLCFMSFSPCSDGCIVGNIKYTFCREIGVILNHHSFEQNKTCWLKQYSELEILYQKDSTGIDIYYLLIFFFLLKRVSLSSSSSVYFTLTSQYILYHIFKKRHKHLLGFFWCFFFNFDIHDCIHAPKTFILITEQY